MRPDRTTKSQHDLLNMKNEVHRKLRMRFTTSLERDSPQAMQKINTHCKLEPMYTKHSKMTEQGIKQENTSL